MPAIETRSRRGVTANNADVANLMQPLRACECLHLFKADPVEHTGFRSSWCVPSPQASAVLWSNPAHQGTSVPSFPRRSR